ncbi:Bifunctional purine biosynthesis protein PurH [Basidiobolus ranarum]|uniref:Bifunctional purine biosynthesis protein PurH n=1 Tax=Basidiobolus ranarum TaxID=34480 RepID=A0ABR2W5R2_9FUNG
MKSKIVVEHEHENLEVDSREFTISPYIAFCAFTCALSSFSTGYNIGSPNTVGDTISQCDPSQYPPSTFPPCFPMGPTLWGFSVGIFSIGCLIGGLGAGPVAERIGRKKALMLNNIFFIGAGLLQGLAPNIPILTIGRLVSGFGGGAACVLVPTYNAEIATRRYSGTIGVMTQAFMVTGTLVSQSLGLVLNTVPGWRILFALSGIIAMIQVILLPFCTETPYWYLHKGSVHESKAALQRFRPGCIVDREFEELKMICRDDTKSLSTNEINDQPSGGHRSLGLLEILSTPFTRGRLLNALVIHIIQQLSGINGILLYSSSIFRSSFGAQNSLYVTVGIAALMVVMTIVSSAIIDRVGRKPLLLLGDVTISVSLTLLVIGSVLHINTLVIISVSLFVCGFAIGIGPIPWMITPELLPPTAVGAGTSAAVAVNWFVNFCVGFAFPSLQASLQGWTFLPFAIFTALAAVYIILYVPETKNIK